MEKLINGIHHFEANIFRERHALFQQLVGGQHPQALFITCSDSRMVPSLITQADPGDLFVLRNAGNIVPTYGSTNGSGAEAATIEYAIRGLGIKEIVVCGHTRCGAMQALLQPESLDGMPRVREWLRHSDACKEVVETVYADLPPEAKWKVAIEENVLTQIENLRTHPAVAVGLAQGDLKLHAWVYKMETGQVFAYDPQAGQYEPLKKADGAPLVSVVPSRKPLPNGLPVPTA
jgi:carbonic anhydrase